MITLPPVFDDRKKYTTSNLAKFKEAVDGLQILKKHKNLCIYITGSYGRQEASEESDLDLFFISSGPNDQPHKVPRLAQFQIFSELVKLASDMGFKEFSNDGEYLHIHYLDDIGRLLGGRDDDHNNHFTARLLLLLESQCVYNEDAYQHILGECINFYYRDYHDHVREFRATFLANDIIRFWKTFCLNYENNRNRPPADQTKRFTNHLKNLKLKFSRLWTCFSMILCLAEKDRRLDPAGIEALVKMSPKERILHASEGNSTRESIVTSLLEDYSWFLVQTGHSKDDTLLWIGNPVERELAFQKAKGFGDKMYGLLVEVADKDTMRFLMM